MAAYVSRQRNREAGCVTVRPMLTVKCIKSVPVESALKRKETHCINVHFVIMHLDWSNIHVIKSRKTRLTGPVERVRDKA
jgi:hypothetical protein